MNVSSKQYLYFLSKKTAVLFPGFGKKNLNKTILVDLVVIFHYTLRPQHNKIMTSPNF